MSARDRVGRDVPNHEGGAKKWLLECTRSCVASRVTAGRFPVVVQVALASKLDARATSLSVHPSLEQATVKPNEESMRRGEVGRAMERSGSFPAKKAKWHSREAGSGGAIHSHAPCEALSWRARRSEACSSPHRADGGSGGTRRGRGGRHVTAFWQRLGGRGG